MKTRSIPVAGDPKNLLAIAATKPVDFGRLHWPLPSIPFCDVPHSNAARA